MWRDKRKKKCFARKNTWTRHRGSVCSIKMHNVVIEFVERYRYSWRYSQIFNCNMRYILPLLCRRKSAGGVGPCPSFSGLQAAGELHGCCCVWWCVHASCITESLRSRNASVCAFSNTPAPEASEKEHHTDTTISMGLIFVAYCLPFTVIYLF